MTKDQKIQILKLRATGYGYKRIAQKLGISPNTVKSFCRRHKTGDDSETEFSPALSGETTFYKEALKWYMKAAELCNVEAIIKLGTTYEEGLGVEKNYGEAYRWYQRAAGFFGSGAEDQLKDLLEKKFGPELLQKSGADVFMDFQCN